MTDFPIERLDSLPRMLHDKYPRWAIVRDRQSHDEALHILDRCVALGLEARVEKEATGWRTLARIRVEVAV